MKDSLDFSLMIKDLISIANNSTEDSDEEIRLINKNALENPLSNEEANLMLANIINQIKKKLYKINDREGANSLIEDTNALVAEMVLLRKELLLKGEEKMRNNTNFDIELKNFNGVMVAPVFPSPWFHEKEIPMNSGYINLKEIKLWEENDRLNIHVNQFKNSYNRLPDAEEVLNIMLSNTALKGLNRKDEFQIKELARSIANNGVRRPPIIDIDGTLLDGNRRITACKYILQSKEFSKEQKVRVENIFVWQLTRHATDDDRRRVVVAMNFEKDYKQDWPEYVKASKIYEEWESYLSLEPFATPSRLNEIKREISNQYALGPDARYVSRYIKMVEEAQQFEDYLIEKLSHDEYEVKYKSTEYFQYFDELSKKNVLNTLNQDLVFRNLVYELLFSDKFVNWKQIRDLPKLAGNEDARKLLRQAKGELDLEEAQELVINACSLVQVSARENRIIGANDRIENFTKFLLDLPIGAFTDGTLQEQSIVNLRKAYMYVNQIIEN